MKYGGGGGQSQAFFVTTVHKQGFSKLQYVGTRKGKLWITQGIE
jgi:hypothetical protein